MADLLAMSSAIIDGSASAEGIGPINRINHELSEIGDGVAMVEAFSHCVLFETGDGLVAFDTSGPQGGGRVVEAVVSEPIIAHAQPSLLPYQPSY